MIKQHFIPLQNKDKTVKIKMEKRTDFMKVMQTVGIVYYQQNR